MQAGGWNTATFCDMSGIPRGAKCERDEIGDLTDDQVSKLGRRCQRGVGQQRVRIAKQKFESVRFLGDRSHHDVIDVDHKRRQDRARNSNDGRASESGTV